MRRDCGLPHKPTMSGDEVATALCLSRDAIEEAVQRGELPALRVRGRSIRIPTLALHRLLRGDPPEKEEAPATGAPAESTIAIAKEQRP